MLLVLLLLQAELDVPIKQVLLPGIEGWSHNFIFICCMLAAALSGFATLLMSDKPITSRNIGAYLLWFGMAGLGTSMLGFDYLGGKQKPWRVIGASIVIGMGVVKITDLGPVFMRVLRSAIGESSSGRSGDKPDDRNK
jgi:hypothetical protein